MQAMFSLFGGHNSKPTNTYVTVVPQNTYLVKKVETGVQGLTNSDKVTIENHNSLNIDSKNPTNSLVLGDVSADGNLKLNNVKSKGDISILGSNDGNLQVNNVYSSGSITIGGDLLVLLI